MALEYEELAVKQGWKTPPTFYESLGMKILPRWALRCIMDIEFTTEEFYRQISKTLPPGSRVLDLGAGECAYKDKFFKHTYYTALDFCKGDPGFDYSRINLFSDISSLPFRIQAFDFVFCFQVLEHLPEPKKAMLEMSRVLKPNGKLFLSTPQSWPQHQKPYDFYRFTSFGLNYLFRESGFDVVWIKPFGGYFRFLSLNLKGFHKILFDYPKRNILLKAVLFPLEAVSILMLRILAPILLFSMDGLDKNKDYTYSYMACGQKIS